MFTHEKVRFHKKNGVKFDIESYQCPDNVKNSFYNLKKSTEYKWNNNTVCFFYKSGNCDRKCNHIASLLKVIQPPNYPLRADIILSPIKKYYPSGKIFGPEHVNTGYASDEKIVIYREEEWFKVFIHECFHFFHYEKKLFDPELAERILKLFPVDSEVNLFESYCEFMARTLNCHMISSYTKISIHMLMDKEKKHSMYHMVNVLHHMGLKYNDILGESDFKENTNVLAYIVLTNILMHHNYSSDSFELTDGDAYVSFIEKYAKDDFFKDQIAKIVPQQTTTMTILSIDEFNDIF